MIPHKVVITPVVSMEENDVQGVAHKNAPLATPLASLGSSEAEGTSAALTDAPSPQADMQTRATALCHRAGSHIFVFAGGDIPEGWPCDCGQTTFAR